MQKAADGCTYLVGCVTEHDRAATEAATECEVQLFPDVHENATELVWPYRPDARKRQANREGGGWNAVTVFGSGKLANAAMRGF
jgi:hypothetical protein